MKPAMWRTFWLLIAVAFALIAYDFWTAWHDGTDSTISWTITFLGMRRPFIPLAIGVLIGHLFGSQNRVGCSRYDAIAEQAVGALRLISISGDLKQIQDTARPVVIAALNIDDERQD